MRLVACTQEYWEFVRTLRTDPRTSGGFVQQAQITPQQQKEYMTKYAHKYFICVIDEKPAGFVGSIDNDIRVCTHPDFQGRGVGSFMIKELVKIFPTAVAKVRVSNKASNALFLASGFVPTFTIYEKAERDGYSG